MSQSATRRRFSALTQIEHDRPIHPSDDSPFLHALKLGLLLALREQGLLDDLQLRLAMEELA